MCEAKIAKICNFWTFRSVTQLTDATFKHCKQSGTLHFDATYGRSHKIVTFCTLQYLLQAEMVNLFICYGVLTRGHHFNDFAKSHHNLTYQTERAFPSYFDAIPKEIVCKNLHRLCPWHYKIFLITLIT